MLRVHKYRVTPKAFPAYNLVRKRVPPLLQRYIELTEEIGINDRFDIPEFGTIDVNIVEKANDKTHFNITDVVRKKSFVEQIGETRIDNITAYLEEEHVVSETCSIELVLFSENCVLSEEISALSKTYKNCVFVIIEDSDKRSESNGLASCHNVLKTTKESANHNVADMLEKIVLKAITIECENVKFLLDKKKELDNFKKLKGKCEFDQYLNDNYTGCDNTRTNDARKLDNINISDDVVEKLCNVDRNNIESMLAEMTALFRTSCLPEDEWPDFKVCEERQVDEQLQSKLFSISPAVKGMGYSSDRLVICIEEPTHTYDYDSVLKSIRLVMDGSGVANYTVEEISKELKTYSCGVRVGAKIETGGPGDPVCGTLGCFASMEKGNCRRRCAVISKHVAACGKDFICQDCGINVGNSLGHVVQETLSDTGLDIAALLLNESVNISAKYKSEDTDLESDLLQCKLHDYIEDSNSGILSNGQQVYIWGATSQPGKGVITIPIYKIDGMENGLILIEDRFVRKGEIPERFCRPGDSGAVVCAEDRHGEFVHVIAMLIGILNEDAVVRNPTTRGKYLSLPLSTGMQELTKRTGYSFELCESINS